MALYSLNLCIAYTQGIKKSVGRGVKAAAQIADGRHPKAIYFTHLTTLFFTISWCTCARLSVCHLVLTCGSKEFAICQEDASNVSKSFYGKLSLWKEHSSFMLLVSKS